MIVDGRAIAVILIYIFTFLGYLEGKDIKRCEKLDALKKFKHFAENYKKEKK